MFHSFSPFLSPFFFIFAFAKKQFVCAHKGKNKRNKKKITKYPFSNWLLAIRGGCKFFTPLHFTLVLQNSKLNVLIWKHMFPNEKMSFSCARQRTHKQHTGNSSSRMISSYAKTKHVLNDIRYPNSVLNSLHKILFANIDCFILFEMKRAEEGATFCQICAEVTGWI